MQNFVLIYASRAIRLMDNKTLDTILAASRKNNPRNELTGMLLYGRGHFIQLLEGPEEKVRETYERISSDTRHSDVAILFEGKVSERLFPNWSMGVANMTRDKVEIDVQSLWDSLDIDVAIKNGNVDSIYELFTAFKRQANLPAHIS